MRDGSGRWLLLGTNSTDKRGVAAITPKPQDEVGRETLPLPVHHWVVPLDTLNGYVTTSQRHALIRSTVDILIDTLTDVGP